MENDEVSMKMILGSFVILLSAWMLSGCVTSHYANDKGFECTRKYFTPFGISTHSCSETKAATEAGAAQGTELKVAPGVPEPSLRQTNPAKTIAQNIKSTTQGLVR